MEFPASTEKCREMSVLLRGGWNKVAKRSVSIEVEMNGLPNLLVSLKFPSGLGLAGCRR